MTTEATPGALGSNEGLGVTSSEASVAGFLWEEFQPRRPFCSSVPQQQE